MRRFYSLSVQPTLFGGASLVRDWGRIGTRGQSMIETFDTPAEAGVALTRLERRKRRRGYLDAFVSRSGGQGLKRPTGADHWVAIVSKTQKRPRFVGGAVGDLVSPGCRWGGTR